MESMGKMKKESKFTYNKIDLTWYDEIDFDEIPLLL